jgi:hypothetical protein
MTITRLQARPKALIDRIAVVWSANGKRDIILVSNSTSSVADILRHRKSRTTRRNIGVDEALIPRIVRVNPNRFR